MTPFELSVLELLRMAPTPLYSMYWSVTDKFSGRVSIASFFRLVDELLSAGSVELWQSLESGGGRRLESVPPDLEIYYSKVERDRSYDPFDFVLQLGANAPTAEESDWELQVDPDNGAFRLEGPSDLVPADLADALQPVGTVLELDRSDDGATIRIEGFVRGSHGPRPAMPAAAGATRTADLADLLHWLERWYVAHCDGEWEHQYGITIETLDNPGWTLTFDVGDEAVAFEPVEWDDGPEWLHARLEESQLKVACGPRSLRRALELVREALTWRSRQP